jgi:hypothetical protein
MRHAAAATSAAALRLARAIVLPGEKMHFYTGKRAIWSLSAWSDKPKLPCSWPPAGGTEKGQPKGVRLS